MVPDKHADVGRREADATSCRTIARTARDVGGYFEKLTQTAHGGPADALEHIVGRGHATVTKTVRKTIDRSSSGRSRLAIHVGFAVPIT